MELRKIVHDKSTQDIPCQTDSCFLIVFFKVFLLILFYTLPFQLDDYYLSFLFTNNKECVELALNGHDVRHAFWVLFKFNDAMLMGYMSSGRLEFRLESLDRCPLRSYFKSAA